MLKVICLLAAVCLAAAFVSQPITHNEMNFIEK
jgi:hypothetical protein